MGDRYTGRRVLVAGAAVAGAAAAEVLLRHGASVTVVDRTRTAHLGRLAALGARVTVGSTDDPALLRDVDDVVVSPGFTPRHPLAAAAVAAGLDVYSEPELAWRLRGPQASPWLAVTGTNGKTTTTTMLAAILRAAGLRTAALGNIGEPLVFAAAGYAEPGYDVLAVELSSFQLYWSSTLAPQVGAWLNLADDHLDWHGSFAAYAAAKRAIWRAADTGGTAIGNLDDPFVAARLAEVPGRTVGVTLGEPGPGQFGVVDGVLVDHATHAEPVALVDASAVLPSGAHNVSNALHAAALARVYGVSAAAVREGLSGYQPEPHRNAFVASHDGVDFVDDSKATNPHAAYASLTAYPSVVWIAGGQLKGADVDGLVRDVAGRLRGAVLLGVDRALIAESLARHAPGIPVVDVATTDDGAMREVVEAAVDLARPGDTVLLAPAAASLDMYPSYARRGDQFVAAVRSLTERRRAASR
ncbi:MAG TPA: UDP-N-acetylmuramoyl-L-alanine--D-glutamate ligase [Micromonosporaceae bacterium]